MTAASGGPIGAVAAFVADHSKLIDQIGINAMLALSLSLSLRAGQLALAQAALMGIGAYVGSIGAIAYRWPLWESLVAGAGAAGVTAFVIALPLGRLRGVFLAIATVAFGEIARIVENNLEITGGAEGLSGIPSDVHTPLIYAVLALCGLAVWSFRFGVPSFALAIAALREDEVAARGIGLDTARVRVTTFVLGALVAGLAGVLYAHESYFITPGDFGFPRMEQILVSCVIGGVTSSLGAVLGAVLMTILPEAIRFLADYRELSTGLILLGIIVFAPAGIAGLWSRAR